MPMMLIASKFAVPIMLLILGWLAGDFVASKEVSVIAAEADTQVLGVGELDNLRPTLVYLGFFLPAIAAWIQALSPQQDRYVGKKFLLSLAMITGMIGGLWVLLDVQGRLEDFGDSPELTQVLEYYLITSPAVFAELLPYCVLIAAIVMFSELSKHREIIALVQSGRSLLAVAKVPIFHAILLSVGMFIVNFHWAPIAEAQGELFLERQSQKNAENQKSKGPQWIQSFNAEHNRLWFLSNDSTSDSNRYANVSIIEYDENQEPVYRWNAKEAIWLGEKGWELLNVSHFKVDKTANIPVSNDSLLIKPWKETPRQLILPKLDPEAMGVTHLWKWLSINQAGASKEKAVYKTHFHQRWASSFLPLAYVLIAIPLACYFDRRSSSSAIVSALLILFVIQILQSLTLALGESGRLSAFLSAWLINALLLLTTFYLWIKNIHGLPLTVWVASLTKKRHA